MAGQLIVPYNTPTNNEGQPVISYYIPKHYRIEPVLKKAIWRFRMPPINKEIEECKSIQKYCYYISIDVNKNEQDYHDPYIEIYKSMIAQQRYKDEVSKGFESKEKPLLKLLSALTLITENLYDSQKDFAEVSMDFSSCESTRKLAEEHNLLPILQLLKKWDKYAIEFFTGYSTTLKTILTMHTTILKYYDLLIKLTPKKEANEIKPIDFVNELLSEFGNMAELGYKIPFLINDINKETDKDLMTCGRVFLKEGSNVDLIENQTQKLKIQLTLADVRCLWLYMNFEKLLDELINKWSDRDLPKWKLLDASIFENIPDIYKYIEEGGGNFDLLMTDDNQAENVSYESSNFDNMSIDLQEFKEGPEAYMKYFIDTFKQLMRSVYHVCYLARDMDALQTWKNLKNTYKLLDIKQLAAMKIKKYLCEYINGQIFNLFFTDDENNKRMSADSIKEFINNNSLIMKKIKYIYDNLSVLSSQNTLESFNEWASQLQGSNIEELLTVLTLEDYKVHEKETPDDIDLLGLVRFVNNKEIQEEYEGRIQISQQNDLHEIFDFLIKFNKPTPYILTSLEYIFKVQTFQILECRLKIRRNKSRKRICYENQNVKGDAKKIKFANEGMIFLDDCGKRDTMLVFSDTEDFSILVPEASKDENAAWKTRTKYLKWVLSKQKSEEHLLTWILPITGDNINCYRWSTSNNPNDKPKEIKQHNNGELTIMSEQKPYYLYCSSCQSIRDLKKKNKHSEKLINPYKKPQLQVENIKIEVPSIRVYKLETWFQLDISSEEGIKHVCESTDLAEEIRQDFQYKVTLFCEIEAMNNSTKEKHILQKQGADKFINMCEDARMIIEQPENSNRNQYNNFIKTLTKTINSSSKEMYAFKRAIDKGKEHAKAIGKRSEIETEVIGNEDITIPILEIEPIVEEPEAIEVIDDYENLPSTSTIFPPISSPQRIVTNEELMKFLEIYEAAKNKEIGIDSYIEQMQALINQLREEKDKNRSSVLGSLPSTLTGQNAKSDELIPNENSTYIERSHSKVQPSTPVLFFKVTPEINDEDMQVLDKKTFYRCLAKFVYDDEEKYKEIQARVLKFLYEKEQWVIENNKFDTEFETHFDVHQLEKYYKEDKEPDDYEIAAFEALYNCNINICVMFDKFAYFWKSDRGIKSSYLSGLE